MTRNGLIILLLLLSLVVGCKKEEQTLPQNPGMRDDIPYFPKEPTSVSTTDHASSSQQPNIELPPKRVRFEPVRQPSGRIVSAMQQRERDGYKPGDGFSLEQAVEMGKLLRKNWPQQPPLDEQQLRAQGIRLIKGKHLTLCTDLPPSEEVDRLPEIFDLAVSEYCRFFKVDAQHVADWQMRGFLIDELEIFRKADLIGPFPTHLNGFSVDDQLWVREQKSDYYRRHLLLHEGVHGFMNYVFGTCGPVWYMEATAEYLGTHRWEDNQLALGAMPQHTQEMPGWQRIELVKRDIAAGNLKTLDKVIRYSGRFFESSTDYAWVWSLGTLLDNHPRYRDAFRDAVRWLTFPDFSNRFYLQLADQWPVLQVEWLCFVDELSYGHNVPRMAIDPISGEILGETASQTFEVDASRGWQSSGVKFEAGKTYRLTATGRYQLGDTPKLWFSEPNGVTIRYHNGQPIGLLIGAVVPDALFEASHDAKSEISPESVPFLRPMTIGPGIELTPEQSGTLYLRVNDSPADLHDNQGSALVEIMRP
jgi:hypothetical protein